MASPSIESQFSASLTTTANEDRLVILEEAQHISSIVTNSALFKHFVGNSEQGDQRKALDFFN